MSVRLKHLGVIFASVIYSTNLFAYDYFNSYQIFDVPRSSNASPKAFPKDSKLTAPKKYDGSDYINGYNLNNLSTVKKSYSYNRLLSNL